MSPITLTTLDRDLKLLAADVRRLAERTASIENKLDAGLVSRGELTNYVTKAEFRPIAYFVYFIMASLGAAVMTVLWQLILRTPG